MLEPQGGTEGEREGGQGSSSEHRGVVRNLLGERR